MDGHASHDHDCASHGHEGGAAAAHLPDRSAVGSGLGLAALGGALCWASARVIGKSWLFAPAGISLAIAGLLAGWAAAIHLTGGEQFDDHPNL